MKYLILLVSCLLASLVSQGAQAATYWVSPTGNNASCATIAASGPTTTVAKTTIDAGIGCMAAGDTLNIRAGTYTGTIRQTGWPSGSAGAYTTVQAYNNETVTVPMLVLYGDANNHHILIRGISIDGTGQGANNGGLVLYLAHDITLENLDIHHVTNNNQLSEVQRITIRGSTFRDGTSPCVLGGGDRWYGLYVIKTTDTVIENNLFHHLPGGGVHAYNGGATPFNSNLTIRNNIMHDVPSCPTSNIGGFLISDTSSGQAYNNVIYNTLMMDAGRLAPGMYLFGGNTANFNLYGNTVYAAGYGIFIEGGVSGTINIKNNILSTNTVGSYYNSSPATIVADHNLCSSTCGFGSTNQTESASTTFNDAANAIFTLKTGSLAINNGTPLSSPFNVSIDGTTRPQPAGGNFDIGAYETSGSAPSCPAVSPALVASYGFEGNGNDSNGVNTATLGSGWSYTTGKYGQGVVSTGVSGITVADANALDMCGGFTYAAWVNLPNTTGPYALINKNPDSSSFLFAALDGYCGVGRSVGGYSTASTSAVACYGTPLTTGFQHLAVTYDATLPSANVKMYLNGSLVTTADGTALLDPTTGTLQFCASSFGEICPSGTILDEVRIYNYARSGAQIVSDRDTPIIAPSLTPPTLKLSASGMKFGASATALKLRQ